jgi:hypothetical protein
MGLSGMPSIDGCGTLAFISLCRTSNKFVVRHSSALFFTNCSSQASNTNYPFVDRFTSD